MHDFSGGWGEETQSGEGVGAHPTSRFPIKEGKILIWTPPASKFLLFPGLKGKGKTIVSPSKRVTGSSGKAYCCSFAADS